MKRTPWTTIGRFFAVLFAAASCCGVVKAQTPTVAANLSAAAPPNTSEVLNRIDQLIEQNQQLEKHNQELMTEITSLRQALAEGSGVGGARTVEATYKTTQVATAAVPPAPSSQQEPEEEQYAATELEPKAIEQEPYKWGAYTPNLGYKVANTDHGDLSVSIYSYGRYLNQLGLNSTYTDAFGNVKNVQRRQDFQLNKVQIKFLGWVMDPKFRYFLYAWTSNASQGLGAQVVLAGNLNYSFNDHLNVGAGIRSLPGTRSVEGNFPFWLGVDTRLIGDEFFRPSYSSGVWAWGKITPKLDYIAMVANNLSTLGVSAAQLDNGFNTFSGSLVWMPTTGEFGRGFGDFEHHDQLASRFGIHFTRSTEDKQSQPTSNQFENTQIRLEDGTVIFTPGIFGPGVEVDEVRYRMADFDVGLKYKGLSLDAEYFLRWLDNFKGPGTAGLPLIFSRGYQMQFSAMVQPKTVQVYLGGSTLTGKYGNPWDFRAGVNYFPFQNRVVRWNSEFLYLYQSPVGYTSVPFALGGTGPVFHTNLELAF